MNCIKTLTLNLSETDYFTYEKKFKLICLEQIPQLT